MMDLITSLQTGDFQSLQWDVDQHPAPLTVCDRRGDFLIHHAVKHADIAVLRMTA